VLLRHAHVLRMLVLTTFLVGIAAVTFASPAHAAFEDTRGQTFNEAVAALAEEGVIYGCEEDRYCPTNVFNRGQLASVLVRALDLPATSTSHFDDTEGTEHEDNINALAEAGITNGCAEDAYCPMQGISRAEMASMLTRAFDVAATGDRYFSDIGGTHAANIDAVAAAGITNGCGGSAYCPQDTLPRWQAAYFVARSMELVDRVDTITLAEYREREAQQQQAQRDAERDQMWEDLAGCESNHNWQANTGNGYYGGLQFALSSWQSVGGSGYPHNASRDEQIHRAEILLERQGWGAWPSCSRQLGYR
jgi:hypothetical protein